MDKKSQTLGTYNASAQAMADKFNAIGPRVRDIAQAFSYVKKENPMVLELGCGNGRDAKEILRRTNNYLGVDYSEELLSLARAQTPEGKFELADVEHFSFPAGLDIIFAFASLLHSNRDTVQRILIGAREALNRGGICFLSLKHGAYEEKIVTDSWGTRTFYLYTPKDIEELTAGKLVNSFEHVRTAKDGQEWFEIILQK